MLRRIITIALVLVLFISSALLLHAYPVQTVGLPEVSPSGTEDTAAGTGKLSLAFSEPGYFYDSAIEVSITASVDGAKIYYTTDGSEPTRESKEYSEPLEFRASRNVKAVTLKAIAVDGDTVTRPLVHTYFLGTNITSRFDTLVFSLSTDDEHLYDYDTGILVEGRLRDEYEAQHPNENIDPPAPANYNWRGMEGERPVYVEVFTPEGERVVAQAAGVRVSGGWSRASDQKSLRLIARNEYEPGAGKFHYDFFPGETTNGAYGQPLTKFDSIVLRNGANDREFGMLRNEVASVLAREAGFRDVTPVRAAAVFLNGEYYGFTWLQVSVNEQYLQDVYSAPVREFDIVGNGEQWLDTDDTAAKESLELMQSYAYKDLRNDTVFAELEEMVDIDNLLWYYAFEMYMGNNDWPGNNMKRWRYTGPQEEGLAPELDGRWRYIMYDLDWTLGLYGDDYTERSFNEVLGGGRNSPLLSALLKRPELADSFAAIICDIASNVVNADTVSAGIDELYAEARKEIDAAFSARKYAGWVGIEWVLSNHTNMINFARSRSVTVNKFLRDRFSYGELFEIRVTGGEAYLNTVRGTSAKYFTGLTVPVSPALPKFTVFDHWLVNGEAVYEPELELSAAYADYGVIKLELVTREELPPLTFGSAISVREANGCVLINGTEQTVSTGGLFISDSPDNLLLWEIPAASVAPGASLSFAGKGSADKDDLMKVQLPFRVKSGEVLYLSNGDGTVLDYISVP